MSSLSYWIALNIALASLMVCLMARVYSRLLNRPYSQHQYLGYCACIVSCLMCPVPIIALQASGIGWMQPPNPRMSTLDATDGSETKPDGDMPSATNTEPPAVKVDDRSVRSVPATAFTVLPQQVAAVTAKSVPDQDSYNPKPSRVHRFDVCLAAKIVDGVVADGNDVLLLAINERSGLSEATDCLLTLADVLGLDALEELQLHCGFKPFIQQSKLVGAPLTYGVLRPVIVVPAGIEVLLDRPQLIAVLLHECRHWRGMIRASVGQAIAGSLFWWNPLVYFINQRLHAIREVLCDDFVGHVANLPESLAMGMVKLAEHAVREPSATVCEPNTTLCSRFFGFQQTIPLRIERLVNRRHDDVEHSALAGRLAGIGYAVCLLAVCIPVLVPANGLASAQEKTKSEVQVRSESKGNLAGWVRDQDGNPLKDITVWMSVVGIGENRGRDWLQQTKTDAEGMYEFTIKDTGFMNLAATGDGWCWASRHLFEVKPQQQVANQNFVLTPARRVQLEVEDEQGKPVEDVKLEQLGWSLGDESTQWLLSSIAQASGGGMPVTRNGNKLILDKLPQHAKVIARVCSPKFALSLVKIGENESQSKKVILHRGYPLHVKVVKIPAQEPIAKHKVMIVYYDHSDMNQVVFREETTDDNGNCTFLIGHAHHLSVRAEHPQYVSRKWHQFNDWGEEPTEKSIQLELTENLKVRGRVLEAGTNEPAAHTNVGIIITPGQIFTSTNTDAEGYYELEGAVGPAEIVPSWGSGYYVDEQAKVKVELKAGETVQAGKDLVLRKIPPFTGVVTENGQFVENAIVHTTFHSSPAVTDGVGRFTLPVRNEGLQFLEAVHLASHTSGAVAVPREMIGKPQQIRIELHPNAELRGRIADWNPQDKTPKEIYLARSISFEGAAQSSNVGAACIDEHGEFVFTGLNIAFEYKVSPRMLGNQDDEFPWMTLTQGINVMEPLRGLELADAGTFDRNQPPLNSASFELSCSAWHNATSLSLEQLRGKVVLLHFFNSKHSGCQRELRLFNALHEAYSSKGLVVIGVHRHTEPFDKAVQLAKSLDVRYPIAQDSESGALAKSLELGNHSASYLIDKSGGFRRPDEDVNRLIRQIERSLAE